MPQRNRMAPQDRPVIAWPTADGLDVCDALTMQEILAAWGRWYHIECLPGGIYRATRPDGFVLPEADTPAGLESAIRADYARWNSR